MSAPPPLPPNTHPQRRQRNENPPRNQKRRRLERAPKPVKEGGTEEVLQADISSLISTLGLSPPETPFSEQGLPPKFTEIELTIKMLSSTGDGLAEHSGRIYVVPFSIPEDIVIAKVIRHTPTHSVTDFLSVKSPSQDRDDSLISCKYFNTCSGCQFQMLPYAKQLEHKRNVIQKAYDNFSNLDPKLLPSIGDTVGSPLQYGYRTKLTPHFDGPRRGGFKAGDPIPDIGFMVKGQRQVLDIEDCPIGTEILRKGIKTARNYVQENLHTYKRGATILLRESTTRRLREESEEGNTKWVEEKECITDNNAQTTEYIGDYKFVNPAGAFFQNNNSILPAFTDYVRSKLHYPVVTTSPDGAKTTVSTPPKYLVDAYCGSGLFTILCGKDLTSVIGVDIAADSIAYASSNAAANNIKNARFIAGNAEKIFESIDFPGTETSVIIDPPRKGCDKLFLNQLLEFKPKRVVYVSCNVHTQARDLGYILNEGGSGYRVDEIRGFDFFPQTHHVEGVAVLTWVSEGIISLPDDVNDKPGDRL
ncbi:S-adenosyl-L-methionine-dependent methyltransferase [Choiromyces venosus 120613-1]|uniref:S-adenosyl-L-methionine-dependent methyltransferase n=1 Tax=Choiromyces venosus 120613-1 TaxID=1336337 RepID=A0A3N4JBN5_9PEZI|nr:S-adenosyl-L-methionine-dependent methyltransferase [Choiromyces venosus 120613-1]